MDTGGGDSLYPGQFIDESGHAAMVALSPSNLFRPVGYTMSKRIPRVP